jgi:hypothetical protein
MIGSVRAVGFTTGVASQVTAGYWSHCPAACPATVPQHKSLAC